METRIDVFPLPDLIPAGYRPEAAVFIDVLRATSTITTALAAGAKKIIPMSEPQEIRRLQEEMIAADPKNREEILTGGERNAVLIEGFDFGNSPSSYKPEAVAGKTILFSTTNGTRAILLFQKASSAAAASEELIEVPGEKEEKPNIRRKGGPSVRRHESLPPAFSGPIAYYLASFLNAQAVVNRLIEKGFKTIGIVCSGTDRNYTQEDNLLAGLLVSRIEKFYEKENWEAGRFGEDASKVFLNVQAETVRWEWEQFAASVANPSDFEKRLAKELLASRGGQNLKRAGLTADLRDVVRLDSINLVPEYKLGKIRVS